ncbi:hypothetical protein PGTUg99_031348 [Puccinia graminis f. sp. tritici]|uniref:Uncharacterized protein n=1 Tax=Puccinia graminis f. sp. tritici TaxID=56615 RepID=A0A5B0SJG7_PUCGR|nr:hypothetical protein PGTUg99_031348 [Puccinia graminis f. sp. tritici]
MFPPPEVCPTVAAIVSSGILSSRDLLHSLTVGFYQGHFHSCFPKRPDTSRFVHDNKSFQAHKREEFYSAMVSLSFLLRPMIILCFSFLFGRIIADSGLIRTTYNGAVEETYVCSGEKRVATLLLSGPDKNRMFSWKGKRVTALSGNCDCAPERDGVRLLVCQEEPDFDLHKGTDPDTPPTCCK